MGERCAVCGKNLVPMNTYMKTLEGKTLPLCMNCDTMTSAAAGVNSNNRLTAREYLKGKLDAGVVPPENVILVKKLAGESMTEEEYAQLEGRTGGNNEVPAPKAEAAPAAEGKSTPADTGEPVSHNIPLYAGLVFLALAIILYVVSVNNSYGVANIQATVFAGAAFVSAIVCFAASRIIKAINSK